MCIFVYVWVVCVCVRVCVCLKVRKEPQVSLCYLPYFQDSVSHWPGKYLLDIHLSLPPKLWDCKHMPPLPAFIHMAPEIQLSASWCLSGKDFTDWAICSAPWWVKDSFFCVSGWLQTHWVAEDNLELLILPPPPPDYWAYRYASSPLV